MSLPHITARAARRESRSMHALMTMSAGDKRDAAIMRSASVRRMYLDRQVWISNTADHKQALATVGLSYADATAIRFG